MINYRRYEPEGLLRQFVRFFWSLETSVAADDVFVHRALPDNCPELIFYCKGKLSIRSGDGDEGATFISGLFGPAQKFRQFHTQNDFHLFGVYLYPFALTTICRLPANVIINEKADSETLFGLEGRILEEQMLLAKTHEHRVRIVSDFFLKKINTASHSDTKFIDKIRSLIEQNDVRSIRSFADDCNFSRRQLERKFRTLSGFTPKDFFSIVRFKKVLQEIEQGNTSLAAIALNTGYYDQSHLTNEFKKLSGYTPKAFLTHHPKEGDQRTSRDFCD